MRTRRDMLKIIGVTAGGLALGIHPPWITFAQKRDIALLPGQQIWKNSISSYLFGTNDKTEITSNNFETSSAIQALVRTGGFTLIRSFQPENVNDATLDVRYNAAQNAGCNMLYVLYDSANTAWNEYVVNYYGNNCLLYEFGNEPDYPYGSLPVASYLDQWNSVVPQLRAINPSAKFIGPALAQPTGYKTSYMQDFLNGVALSGVLPDAISFHLYPCYKSDENTCLSLSATYTNAIQTVRSMVINTLGFELPIAVTEWNYAPSTGLEPYGTDPDFMTQWTTTALNSIIAGGAAVACQFNCASTVTSQLDMISTKTNQPKAQYTAIANIISQYHP